MGATVGNAAATAGLPQVLSQLQGMGVNTQALLGGVAGGGATATPGAGTPAPTAGAQAAGGAAAPAAPQPGVTARGLPVQITSEGGKPRLAAPTGMDEKVELLNANGVKTGQVMLFNGAGVQVRNFELVARQPIKVDLDQRVGIASGISNLSRIVAQRQERLKGLQEALAQDSNETGNTNQLDIQQLVQEQQVSENISNLNHKIYESIQNSMAPWLR